MYDTIQIHISSGEVSPPVSPEHALLRAVLHRAMEDLEPKVFGRVGRAHKRLDRIRADAVAWLSDLVDDSPGSFVFVCQHLGLDPARTSREILHGVGNV